MSSAPASGSQRYLSSIPKQPFEVRPHVRLRRDTAPLGRRDDQRWPLLSFALRPPVDGFEGSDPRNVVMALGANELGYALLPTLEEIQSAFNDKMSSSISTHGLEDSLQRGLGAVYYRPGRQRFRRIRYQTGKAKPSPVSTKW